MNFISDRFILAQASSYGTDLPRIQRSLDAVPPEFQNITSGGPSFETPDPELVQLFGAVAVLLISIFALLDSVSRTNRLAEHRGVSREPIDGVIGAFAYSVLVIVVWFFWINFRAFGPPFHSSPEIVFRVFDYPKLFAPGIWLAAVVPAAFALHYFVLLGFDRGVDEGSKGSNEKEDSESRPKRPQIVPTFQMIYTFVAFTASLIKVLTFFLGTSSGDSSFD